MSLNKAILSGKEHRKPYHGAKAANTTCRNHGSCGYCKNNRMYSSRKRLDAAKAKLKEAIRYQDSNIACSGRTAAGDYFLVSFLFFSNF